MIHKLLSGSGILNSTQGDIVYTKGWRTGEGIVQMESKGNCTVSIQGRMTDDSSWHTIDSTALTTEETSVVVAVYPQMRAIVTAVSAAQTTGGTGTTHASGSITISENPSGALGSTLIAILDEDAAVAYGTVKANGSGADADTFTINDGQGNAVVFEADSTGVQATSALTFGTVKADDCITVHDVSGKTRTFYFVATTGDTPATPLGVEVVIGASAGDTATNFTTAVNAEWAANRLSIEASAASEVVTLRQLTFSADTITATRIFRVAGNRNQIPTTVTSTAWSGGVDAVLATGTVPVKLHATDTVLNDNVFRQVKDEIYKGNLELVATEATSTTVRVTSLEAGAHHNTAMTAEVNSGATVTETGATFNSSVVFENGTDGTQDQLLLIDEATVGAITGVGYVFVDRIEGDDVNVILGNIITAIAGNSSGALSGGTLTGTLNHDGNSMALTTSGGSITNFGNSTIAIVKDPHNIITTTGLTGGAAGVTVLVNIDIPQQ